MVAGVKKHYELPTTDNWLIDLWNESVKHSASDARPLLSEIATHRLQIELAAIGIGFVTGGVIGAGVGSIGLPGVGSITGAVAGAKVGGVVGSTVGLIGVTTVVGGKRLYDVYKKDIPA